MDFLETISGPLFELVGTAVLAIALHVLRKGVALLNQKGLGYLADIAVSAVEQTYKESHGEDKKNAAVDKLVELATNSGLKITTQELDAYIESAVRKMNETVKGK